jgi:hypothetical protein
MPAFGGGDDVLRLGSRLERLGLLIVGIDEGFDGLLQRHDRLEQAALEAALGELGEEAPGGVCQKQDVGTKWDVQRGCWVSHLRTS